MPSSSWHGHAQKARPGFPSTSPGQSPWRPSTHAGNATQVRGEVGRSQGLINDDEYQEKRRQILSEF